MGNDQTVDDGIDFAQILVTQGRDQLLKGSSLEVAKQYIQLAQVQAAIAHAISTEKMASAICDIRDMMREDRATDH